jgi:hypothetical protein
MEVEVNYLAVLLATVSSMVVGSVWYMPKVFGNTWMKLAKVDMDKAKRGSWTPIVGAVVLSALTACVLAHVLPGPPIFGNSFLYDSLSTAFWLWLGFGAARLLTHQLFEMRSPKLHLINAAHELVAIMVMGLIIGLLAP